MHALLSPSSAKRWINCPPSARLEAALPSRTNDAAEEGTLAHRLAELILRFEIGEFNKLQYENLLIPVKAHKFYSKEMLDYVTEYTDYVLETYLAAKKTCKDAVILLEEKIDLTAFIPEGFGTGDVQIIADGTLYFIDLKYGKGVPVYAEGNEQLMVYALGSLVANQPWYSIEKVKIVIYQPRLSSVTDFVISVTDLGRWAALVLKPAANAAFHGGGTLSPGEHCHFCKVAGTCKANAAFNLQIVQQDFSEVPQNITDLEPALVDPSKLNDAEVSFILERSDLLVKWVNSIKENAYEQAKTGKKWPGFKLVEGRSNRVIKDKEGAQKALAQAQFNMLDYYKPSELKGIGDLEKLVGKNNFNSLLGPFIIKPAGAPTLVPVSDKRTELNSIEAAQADFAEYVETE